MDNITRRGINVGYAQTMTWTAEIASRWISFLILPVEVIKTSK